MKKYLAIMFVLSMVASNAVPALGAEMKDVQGIWKLKVQMTKNKKMVSLLLFVFCILFISFGRMNNVGDNIEWNWNEKYISVNFVLFHNFFRYITVSTKNFVYKFLSYILLVFSFRNFLFYTSIESSKKILLKSMIMLFCVDALAVFVRSYVVIDINNIIMYFFSSILGLAFFSLYKKFILNEINL